MNTIRQKYASNVYEAVKKYQKENSKNKTALDEYGGMALKLPVLVHTAGLAQALAFVKSRGKTSLDALLDDLAQVINEKDADNFLKRSREAKLQDYVYLTKKSLTALEWFKRYAQSVLNVESTDDDGSSS